MLDLSSSDVYYINMIDPYRMVFVNIVAFLTMSILVYLYFKIIPKGKINYLLLLFLISLLPLISIARKGGYESGDLSIHGTFAMSFYNSLKDGNFIPRWAGEMYYGYGYPLFIFIYPLPYYIVSSFHLLGFDFTSSIKLLLVFSFLSSGILMYLWIKKILGKIPAFIASVFYLFAPYHLIDMHFRVAIGETLSFAIIPLCFLCAERLTETQRLRWILLLTISLLLLILSHQAISFAIFPFIASYIFLLWKSKKNKNIKSLLCNYSPFICTILLSSFFWLPVIYEARYTHILSSSDIAFPTFSQLFYSPWRLGFLFQGPKGELSYIVGYIQWVIILLSAFLLFKNKAKTHNKKLLIFFFYSFLIIFILMQSVTKPVWQFLFVLKAFQFSSRLLLLEAFFTSVLAGLIVKEINKKWFVITLCVLAIAPTILNWGNRKSISIDDEYLKTQLPFVIGEVIGKNGDIGTSASIWIDTKKFKIDKTAKSYLEVIKGQANIINLKRNSTHHEYLIQTSTTTTFRENTLYFPGWILKINNKKYAFKYNNEKYPGVIIFELPKGTYKADLIFINTPIRTFSTITSILSLAGISLYTILHSFRKIPAK